MSDPIKLFEANITRTESCWVWNGPMSGKAPFGRPQWRAGKHRRSAARMAWCLSGRTIEPHQWLRNECGNRQCVKPEHQRIDDAPEGATQ